MFQHVFLAAEQLNIVDLIKDSTGAVMAVLVILVAMSLVSWYIIAMKAAYLSKARRQSDKFQEVFWHSKRLDNTYKEAEQLVRSPVAQMFRAGYVELTKLKKGEKERDKDAETMELSGIENVERALRRASLAETTELEKLVFPRDNRFYGAIYRAFRHGLGHHARLCQFVGFDIRHGNPNGFGAHRRSPHRNCYRAFGGYSKRHGLQLL